MVFERFTERARHVVVFAQEEARSLKHNYIGTEHILLGLLREDEGLAARVLESFDITVTRVRDEVVHIVGSGEEVAPGQIPFTPRAKSVLELALREAQNLGRNYIGTEHILLGLAGENGGVAIRILLDLDAGPEKLRSEVIRMMPSGPQVSHDLPAHGLRAQSRPQRLRPQRSGLDWDAANLLWRPEGLELRIPLSLSEGAMATFAADEAWSSEPLVGLRREIWNGWLALASTTLLDDIDPEQLRRVLDPAAKRALDVSGREHGRVEDFLRRLRDQP